MTIQLRNTAGCLQVAQAKSDLSLGRESNALTFTDGPTNTSAADEGDIVMENTPVRDLIALPKGARAKRIKAKKRVVKRQNMKTTMWKSRSDYVLD
jgi:hypothetical protein